MTYVHAEGMGLDFPVYHGAGRSLKKSILTAGKLKKDNHMIIVQALRNINFRLAPGDKLGLIGCNGAGKSTLLRVLAGIYEPTYGKLQVEGRLAALIDIGFGMNPELTGRENILLRGLYWRMSRVEIAALEEDVAEFADIDKFIDLPVKTYSTGMGVRLSFAMATAIKPHVLLMDEWIATGDAGFIEKAHRRLEEVVNHADILVLSSHVADVVTKWCNRVIWLEQGRVRADGPAAEILQLYNEASGVSAAVAAEPVAELPDQAAVSSLSLTAPGEGAPESSEK